MSSCPLLIAFRYLVRGGRAAREIWDLEEISDLELRARS